MLKIIATGTLGQDATVRETNGKKAINFSIAHNTKYADKDGVIVESTIWLNCTRWRNEGESLEVVKHLKKGCKVIVEGTPGVSTYKNKDGQFVASLDCRISNFEICTFKENETTDTTPAEKPL